MDANDPGLKMSLQIPHEVEKVFMPLSFFIKM